MKKAKIMLSAIAVFAIAGGVLAFSAKTPSQSVYTGSNCNFLGLYTPSSEAPDLTTINNATISAEQPAAGACTTSVVVGIDE